uniref:Peptidase S8/S53 domain-containing protein n=1 Tax=candidate division WOR-3 bacterium TaxID=2052148 RepID=A0A7V3RG28_UNCW3
MLQLLLIVSSLYNYRAPGINKVDPKCLENEYVRAWVLFTDKGITTERINDALLYTRNKLSSGSLRRRELRNGIIDFGDIPVREEYIEEIQNLGGVLLFRSKWLNGASFLLSREMVQKVAELDFVYKIIPVAHFKRINEEEIALQDTTGQLTAKQLSMFKIDSLHRIGIFGSNVKIGFLDTGLRREHITLDSIKVIAEYDFLQGDQIFVENNPITIRYGIYTNLEHHRRTSCNDLFLIGDTSMLYMPTRDIFWTYSIDGGNNWSDLKNLTNNAHNNWVTDLNICGKDTVFLFYRSRNGLCFMVLDTNIITGPNIIISGGYENPRAVVYGDTVYFFYRDKNNIYLRKGNTQGFPVEMLAVETPYNIKLSTVFAGDSKIGFLYYQYPEDSIFFAWSIIPVLSFNNKFTGFLGKEPKVICAGDTIYMIFKDASTPPFYRIGFVRSDDFGNSFTTTLYLSDYLNSAGKISLIKNGSIITVAWESNGRIYFRESYDGITFSPIDSLNKDFVYLPTPGIVATETKIFYCQRGDNNTDGYSPNDPKYFHPRHGTEMLGLVGGYERNSYIGVAPGAQFIVAKTENPDSLYEFPVEEDTYIAGLEWAESQGADIISSSLGYTDWYNWPSDFDGRTAPASIAVYEATKRGVIVVTAAGNVAIPQLVVPGDAINAITVGGVDSTFQRWRYSGYGPTYDGRLKPEIVCLSAAPVVINPDEKNGYLLSYGTSGATALVSGICALLLEGHPRWNVDSVRNALFQTASFANSPTDSIGYGWPDAAKAFYYTQPEIKPKKECGFLTPFPNPFTVSVHNKIYLPFFLNTKTYVEFRIYSITGRLIKKIETNKLLAPGRYVDTDPNSLNSAFIWDGKDENGNYVGGGLYYCFMYTYGAGNDVTKIMVIK